MPAGHVSARSTLEALAALRSLATPAVWLRARERGNRVGREKAEERARVDGGGVLIDGSLI